LKSATHGKFAKPDCRQTTTIRSFLSGIETLTDEHHPSVVKRLTELEAQLKSMSQPLYIQAALTLELLATLIREQPAYWMQRQPKELLNYYWMVDGKAVQGITPAEEWWELTKGGYLQSKLAASPMMAITFCAVFV
jgi:hypothetical protein